MKLRACSYDLSEAELRALLDSINGVLFPGGGSELEGPFWQTAQRIWNYVLEVGGDVTSSCPIPCVHAPVA